MTDKEKLEKIKKLADDMYREALTLTTDASGLRKAMAEYHQFIINDYHNTKRESPSPLDLEITRYLCDEKDGDTTVGDVARHFAKWQAEQILSAATETTIVMVDGAKGIKVPAIAAMLRGTYEEGEIVKVAIIRNKK